MTKMETITSWLFIPLAVASIFSLLLTHYLICYLKKHGIVARPTVRGMHDHPTPVGGGWAIVPLVTFALVLFPPPEQELLAYVVAVGAMFLAVLSWIDDRRELPWWFRLACQALAIAVVMTLLPPHMTVFSAHWPLWADRLLTALCWLWFVNLFNFMDGIDGLAGMEAVFIAAGLWLIGFFWLGHEPATLVPLAVLAGAAAGFLWYNLPPSRIFLGDVGAIPLGFLLGWFLLELASEGYLAAAFLLPGYFLADATTTLLRRLLAGKAFWKAHREHFYQRAILMLGNSTPFLWSVALTNGILLVLAIVSLYRPWGAAMFGILAVGLLLWLISRPPSWLIRDDG